MNFFFFFLLELLLNDIDFVDKILFLNSRHILETTTPINNVNRKL